MQRNIGFVASLRPEPAYLVPMVEGFDFTNFETRLAEIVDEATNDNNA